MLPFGRCLFLWRLERGFSQAVLAQKAGIPQPNLSDMERGERDVSLRTLRALALALGVQPGILADGIGPKGPESLSLTRPQMERIAQAVVEGSPLSNPSEDRLAQSLRHLTRDRRGALQGNRVPKRMAGGHQVHRHWLALAGIYPPSLVQSLIQRIAEKSSTAGGRG